MKISRLAGLAVATTLAFGAGQALAGGGAGCSYGSYDWKATSNTIDDEINNASKVPVLVNKEQTEQVQEEEKI